MERCELRRALGASGVELNRAAELLFEDPRFTCLRRGRTVEIVALSVADLGFGDGATYAQLLTRAHMSGLGECPLELGPHLRLRFSWQAESAVGLRAAEHRAPPGSLTIASAPLDDREETPRGFYLRRTGAVSWLRGYRASPDHVWCPDAVLVYAREATRVRGSTFD